MAQLNWTYFSLTGLPYRIEIYHGDDSGHLMLFINNAIILIDFNQKETRTYNFLIEHQMLGLLIKKQEDKYEYTVTPQALDWDIEPEKTFAKHFWIPLSILLFLISIAYLIISN